MNYSPIIPYLAAATTAIVALIALFRDPRSFVTRVFAASMGLLAIEAVFNGLALQASSIDAFLDFYRVKIIFASLLPSAWLLFSLSFARANYSEQIWKWKLILLLALVLPLSVATIFNSGFFVGQPLLTASSVFFLPIGWSGHIWHLLGVIFTVLILMNIERTFRHATGHMRWRTKFMFLGIAAIFGLRLFTDSQVILFKGVSIGMSVVNFSALLVADILIIRSLFRGKSLYVNIHLSHQFLYNSFTILIVGIYFICVGVFSWVSLRLEWITDIHLVIFLIFVSIVGLFAILLSDRLRMKRKRFISRHFKRPQYDYQQTWEDFTQRTASVTRTGELCDIIVRLVSETMEILSVSIWLVDEKQERLSFGASTVFTATQAEELKFYGHGGANLIGAMIDQAMPVDLESRRDDWVEDLRISFGVAETKESRIRYCVPLNAAGHLLGIMTLSEKVFYEPITFEEYELIKTIADQAAAALLNLRLSEQLRQAKELEAFQSMSAFFMHDLKNLASKLSLVTQNLPVYMDNPEFRSDALRTISQSVSKINAMSSRLSLLSQKLELTYKQTDLNDLIKETISDVKEYIKAPISGDLEDVPSLLIDRQQMHKVLENLLMNAYDALGKNGQITIATRCQDSWTEIAVGDNGCGMSKEFIEKSLYRPFQTTKKEGMGIGLYHCKTIVEAHGGRIEVESEEGKGTIFRVLLPVAKQGQGLRG